METMPNDIKQKLKQLQMAHKKINKLRREVEEKFEKYNINIDCFTATADKDEFKMQNDALTAIEYDEGYIEENIKHIEEVFLYYVNIDKSL